MCVGMWVCVVVGVCGCGWGGPFNLLTAHVIEGRSVNPV